MHGNACCCRPSQLRCCACATTAVRSRHCSQLTAAHSSSQQLGASSQTDAESIGQLPEHGRAFAGRSPGRPSMDGATAASASSAKKARTVPPSPAQTLSAAHTLPPRDPTPVHEKFEPTKVRLLCAVPTAVPNCCARPLFVHCCVRPLVPLLSIHCCALIHNCWPPPLPPRPLNEHGFLTCLSPVQHDGPNRLGLWPNSSCGFRVPYTTPRNPLGGLS